ncbi:homeodomain superfamily [Pleosporales sp. CAS-2024a]
MTSSQYLERPMGSLAAVRSSFLVTVLYDTPPSSSTHEPTTSPEPSGWFRYPKSRKPHTVKRSASFPSNLHTSSQFPRARAEEATAPRWLSAGGESIYQPARGNNTFHEKDICDKALMNSQHNCHSRNSPPIQPNERGYADKLPSFSEFLITSRADNTPPHTPSRRQGSQDASPHSARPQFDEVAWKEAGHRRIDTLGDLFAQPVRQDHRRISAVDPGLVHRAPSYAPAPAPVQQQRPSYSYSPQQAPAYSAHSRHHSSPAPPAPPPPQQSAYRPSPAHHGLAAPGAYPLPPAHRPSYHQDQHPPAQPYAYAQTHPNAVQSAYGDSVPTVYEHGYGEVRFQPHVGADAGSFQRRRRGNLPKDATNVLKVWFQNHRQQPYPTEDQKIEMCNVTGLTMNQVSNWFINARRRQPLKEQREREANASASASAT